MGPAELLLKNAAHIGRRLVGSWLSDRLSKVDGITDGLIGCRVSLSFAKLQIMRMATATAAHHALIENLRLAADGRQREPQPQHSWSNYIYGAIGPADVAPAVRVVISDLGARAELQDEPVDFDYHVP